MEVRELLEQLFDRAPGGKLAEDCTHRHPRVANARQSTHPVGVDGDALEGHDDSVTIGGQDGAAGAGARSSPVGPVAPSAVLQSRSWPPTTNNSSLVDGPLISLAPSMPRCGGRATGGEGPRFLVENSVEASVEA